MEPASLVFLDPDNGLEGAALGPKSTALAELIAVHRPGRALLLYHHQTRAAGGAELEAARISERIRMAGLGDVVAIRLRPYSSRFYFLMNADEELKRRLEEFAELWRGEAQLYRR